jgi:hypothetical protein
MQDLEVAILSNAILGPLVFQITALQKQEDTKESDREVRTYQTHVPSSAMKKIQSTKMFHPSTFIEMRHESHT